jgi:hypothetical protein
VLPLLPLLLVLRRQQQRRAVDDSLAKEVVQACTLRLQLNSGSQVRDDVGVDHQFLLRCGGGSGGRSAASAATITGTGRETVAIAAVGSVVRPHEEGQPRLWMRVVPVHRQRQCKGRQARIHGSEHTKRIVHTVAPPSPVNHKHHGLLDCLLLERTQTERGSSIPARRKTPERAAMRRDRKDDANNDNNNSRRTRKS